MSEVKILQTKHSEGWTTDDGQEVPSHTLYRYVDAHGKGGCWYSTIERAEKSWGLRFEAPWSGVELRDQGRPQSPGNEAGGTEC